MYSWKIVHKFSKLCESKVSREHFKYQASYDHAYSSLCTPTLSPRTTKLYFTNKPWYSCFLWQARTSIQEVKALLDFMHAAKYDPCLHLLVESTSQIEQYRWGAVLWQVTNFLQVTQPTRVCRLGAAHVHRSENVFLLPVPHELTCACFGSVAKRLSTAIDDKSW